MRERPHQIIQNEAFQFRYCGILILLTLILNFFMHFFIRKQASSTSECQQIKERSTVDESINSMNEFNIKEVKESIYLQHYFQEKKKANKALINLFKHQLIEELQQITAKKSIPFEDSDNTIIGIHLGRTYSRVGIYRYGKFEIIPNEYGSIRTPTVVAIINDHFLVGEEAKNQAIINPNYTFYDLNRLIGKKYTDPSVHKAIKSFTYSVTKDIKNNILIQVPEYEGESPKNFSPEYIQAKIVSKMKKIAENYLGVEVKNAVITVPSNFNDLQKQATKDIGKIADLNVVQILSESKAAAIAYGLDLKKGEKNVFVIDFGGGTLDITIISIQKNFFTDIAHAGDQHLGGEDFDQNLVKHFLYILKTQYKRDLSDDKNVIQNLKIEAQRVKEALSDQNEVTIAIKDLTPGFNFFHTITRTEFEELNAVLFKTVEGVIITALEESILQKSNIDEVLLVGGSSRIPQVQQIVQEFFKGIKVINNRINNELITVGAAIRGAIMSEQPPYDIYSVANVERTSISYGIELYGGIMSVIIPKNRIFPTSLSEIYTTSYNYQKEVKIVIYQGEQEYTIDNTKIGEFILEGIELAPQGIPLIEVTFKLDLDGILNISAVDLNTRSQENKIIITNNMASSNEEIETQKQNNKKEQERDKFNEQNTLIQRESIIIAGEQFVQQYQLKLQSNKFKQSYSKSRLDNIEGLITTFSQWLQKNKENTKILYKEFKLVLENFQQDIESIIDKKEDL